MEIADDLGRIAITLRRSARARRFSLRVSALDGRVTLTLPARAREAEARRFAEGQAGWIRAAVARAAPAAAVIPGCTVPYLGRPCLVVSATGGRVREEAGALLVPGPAERAGARLEAFLKVRARDLLAAASDRHAAAVGRNYTRLVLRDPRSRWGSCSAAGALMYSWRLVMAPPEVLDYVAAHEVAHLVEMNHAPAFWQVVAGLVPDYARHRAWLRRDGNSLHALRFRD